MSSKNNFVLVLILSAVVLVAGSLFYLDQSNQLFISNTDRNNDMFAGGLGMEQQAVIPQADFGKSGRGTNLNRMTDGMSPSPAIASFETKDLLGDGFLEPHGGSLSVSNTSSSIRRKADEDKVYSSGGGAGASDMLLFYAGSRSSGSSQGSGYMSSGSALMVNTAVVPPFGAPRPVDDNGVVLVDPSGDPVNFIPVGDGMSLLLVFVLIYVVLRLGRRNEMM